MIDQLLGLLLVGLGLKNPVTPGAVQGIQTSVSTTSTNTTALGSSGSVGANRPVGKKMEKGLTKRTDAMNQINTKRVEQMRKMLSEVQKILTAAVNKVNSGTVTGDRSAYDAAVIAANSAISTASTALSAQASKTYGAPEPTAGASATGVKDDLSAQKQLMNSDLKTVETQIKAARDAVKTAVAEAKKIAGKKAKISPKPAATVTTAPGL